MKRFLAILLSALMLVSALPIMASAEETTASMTVSYTGNGVFTVSGTVTDGDYKLIVAQYEADGCMLDASTKALTASAGVFSTTVELSYAPAQTKFMLWKTSDATPCVEAVAMPDEGGCNIITTKTEVGTSTGGDLTSNPLTYLVDGNDDTYAMVYGDIGSQGAMYVDLEDSYAIDRIEVLAYHNFYNRGSGFDVVLGNNVPDNTAYAEGTGEYKAGYVAEDVKATSAAVGCKTFYVPADAGAYRYVSLETFDETDGLAVAEINVYVKSNAEQIEYVSVTENATTHKASSTATASTYETDANNALVDGNLSTSYGTGPASGAYFTFIDLGSGGRRVDKVVITANDTVSAERIKGQKYYLANTLPINGADRTEWVYLGTRINSAVPMTFILDENSAGVYRYVVADCTDSAVGGIVSEIEVYKDSTVKEIEYVSVTENATTHLASSTDTAATYDTDASNRLVDGDKTTLYGVGPAANAYYTFIDLGSGGRRVDMVVITTNDTVDANRVVGQKYYLANTLPINGADRTEWVYLGTRAANAVAMTFVLTEEQAGVYRYVVADCTDSAVGGYVNEIEVYKDASVVEAVIPQNVARGKSVTYSHTPFTGYTDSSVITNGVFQSTADNQFIITTRPSAVCIDLEDGYSISKVVIDAVTKDFTKDVEAYISDTPSSGVTIPESATKILEGNSAGWDSSVKTIELETPVDGRYVIIKMTSSASGSFRLSEVEAWGVPSDAPAYVSVTGNATTHKSSAQATVSNYETDASNQLVDGNISTLYGTGPAADAYYTFIDLGEGGKQVDKVVIIANDTYNRTIGQAYYLANTVPVNGADRTEWVYLGTRTENGTAMTFTLTEEQAGVYRYVVADCTSSTVGGYVNEIAVYSLAE